MNVLVDNGIVSGSDFLTGDTRQEERYWGPSKTKISIAGFRRVDPDRDADQQREKDALFTIGRLARANRIMLHTYPELVVEKLRRGRGREPLVNALAGCQFISLPAPIERSKLRSTLELNEWVRKGGRADQKRGLVPSEFTQMAFFRWLAAISSEQAGVLIENAALIGLDDFEVQSLRDLPWFQTLSKAFEAPESLPDWFHLWTARRNRLDVFLTLEKKLPQSMADLNGRRIKRFRLDIKVLRPTGLLDLMGVTNIDPVPVDTERFYSYAEVFKIDRNLLSVVKP